MAVQMLSGLVKTSELFTNREISQIIEKCLVRKLTFLLSHLTLWDQSQICSHKLYMVAGDMSLLADCVKIVLI